MKYSTFYLATLVVLVLGDCCCSLGISDVYEDYYPWHVLFEVLQVIVSIV